MSSFSKKEQIIVVLIVISVMIILGVNFLLQNFKNPKDENVGLVSTIDTDEKDILNEDSQQISSEEDETILIMVHISGQVYSPGIIELFSGDRVIDAVNLAGGLTKDADLDRINLAKKLVDEEKIYVPKIGESDILAISDELNIVSSTQNPLQSDKININTCTKAELDTLPGVGEVTADKIIAYRSTSPFKSIEELKNVSGIGDKKYEGMKDLITVK